MCQLQNQNHTAKEIIRKGAEESQHMMFWHIKLLFQLAVSLLRQTCLFPGN